MNFYVHILEVALKFMMVRDLKINVNYKLDNIFSISTIYKKHSLISKTP